MKRALVAAIVVIALVAGTFAVPRRASASSTTDSLLISAYVAGGVAVIALIAILFANRDDDPEYFEFVDLPTAKKEELRTGVRFAPHCSAANGDLPLACW